MADNTNEIMGQLTSQFRLAPDAVFQSGLGNFLNVDVSGIPAGDQQRVLQILTEEMGAVARRNHIDITTMDAALMNEALRETRTVLLRDPNLPSIIRSFIDEHCAC